MMQSKENTSVPQVTFRTRINSDWLDVTSNDIFKDRKVIVFALPGAFTPTCSSSHLPRYNELAPVFKKYGVDEIICISVNDAFVMNAWSADQKAENIRFIPDGNGDFSRAMGMLVDKTDLGFGERSWRYSMLVENGIIKKHFIEPDKPGDPFEVSDADTMLNFIAPDAEIPKRIAIMTKAGCPFCTRAKTLLASKGLPFEEIELGHGGVSFSSLAAVSGRLTAPQVFVDGQHIGGSEDLDAWVEENLH